MSSLPPIIRPKASVWRILFGSLPAFMVKLCLIFAVTVIAFLAGQQRSWSAKVQAGLTPEVVALSEQPLVFTNVILRTYRSNVPTDTRLDAELMRILGDEQDKIGSFAAYPDFVGEWELLKAHRAAALAPPLAEREPKMVGAYWAGFVLPIATVVILGLSAGFNFIVWLARR